MLTTNVLLQSLLEQVILYLLNAASFCLTHELNFRDVFLRELISNANDALEKLRLTALTEKSVWDGVSPLNVTIKAEKNPDGNGGRIIITGSYLPVPRFHVS